MTGSGGRGRSDVREGFVRTLPLWLGVAAFGVAYALAARSAGLTPLETVGMSLLVYAGSAQFAAAALFAGGAGGLTILLTTLVLNLRHILMAASITPPLRNTSRLRRAAAAFVLVDESYAMSVGPILSGASVAFLLGSGGSLYVCWLLATIAGVFLSATIADPGRLGLDLVFPLSFFVLLTPYLKSRPACVAAAVAGALGLAGRLFIPGAWYLLIAAVGGSIAGILAEGSR